MDFMKKTLKRLGIIIVVLAVLGSLVGSNDDRKSAPASEPAVQESPSISAEESMSILFEDLSSEQYNPPGEPVNEFDLVERVRDSDGDLKIVRGDFKIRVPGSNTLQKIHNLVYIGDTPQGRKLYVSPDPKFIAIDSNQNIKMLPLCPELNQSMTWYFINEPDLENFIIGGTLNVEIEGETISFRVKQGDKVYEAISAAVMVTDLGKGIAENMKNIRDLLNH